MAYHLHTVVPRRLWPQGRRKYNTWQLWVCASTAYQGSHWRHVSSDTYPERPTPLGLHLTSAQDSSTSRGSGPKEALGWPSRSPMLWASRVHGERHPLTSCATPDAYTP